MRYRITVRNDDPSVELRGWVDTDERGLGEFAHSVHPWLVIASPTHSDYNPFGEW